MSWMPALCLRAAWAPKVPFADTAPRWKIKSNSQIKYKLSHLDILVGGDSFSLEARVGENWEAGCIGKVGKIADI